MVAYRVYYSVLLATQFLVFWILLYRIFYYISLRFMDQFKIMQCFWYMLYLALDIVNLIILLSQNKPSLEYQNFYLMIYWYIICFHLSNQLWWITLIIHIRKYKQMNQQHLEYKIVRKGIKQIEYRLRRYFFIFIIVNHAICIYFAVIQWTCKWAYAEDKELKTKDDFIWQFTFYSMEVYKPIMLVIIVAMWVSEYFIYKQMIQTMKTGLSKIYNKRK